MATLVSIFGSEVSVVMNPKVLAADYRGFAGAEGVTRMHLGSRGRPILVTGRLRAASRAALQTDIDAIEDCLDYDADYYTHESVTYYNVVFDKFTLVPVSRSRTFGVNSDGDVFVDFAMLGRCLT